MHSDLNANLLTQDTLGIALNSSSENAGTLPQ